MQPDTNFQSIFCQSSDFFPIIQNPPAFALLIDLLVQHVQAHHPQVDAVFGLESRGFLIGPSLAQRLNVGFLPIRKAGKLPGPVHRHTYTLEYGSDTLEVQSGRLERKSKCLIVDDLLATGGTLRAANHLLKQNGLEVLESLIVIELIGLNARGPLENDGVQVFSLLEF